MIKFSYVAKAPLKSIKMMTEKFSSAAASFRMH